MTPSSRLERLDLPFRVLHPSDGPKDAFGESRRVGVLGQAQNALLDVGREAKEHEHLGDTGPGDALAPGNVGLPGDHAGVEFLPPREGLAEEFDHMRNPPLPGLCRRPGVSDACRAAVDDGIKGQLPRETADVSVFEGPMWPKGDLHSLLAVLGNLHSIRHEGRGRLPRGVYDDVSHAEPDLGFGDSGLIGGSLVDVFPSTRYELIVG